VKASVDELATLGIATAPLAQIPFGGGISALILGFFLASRTTGTAIPTFD
jgi:hypothetical protein